MTTVTVSLQTKQKVTTSQQAKPSVSVYRKGDTGDAGESAYDYAVRVNDYTGTEEEYYAQFVQVGFGDKSSAVDAGLMGQISIGDDYVYFCTVQGTAGNATWKKTVLFQT
jgi:hypothetical protein